MTTVFALLAGLLPRAFAANLDRIGSTDPSVNAMWAIIRNIFPYSNVGAAFPALILAKVVAFVLMLIGGTAVCVMIYAGIELITGGEEKKAEAKKTVTYALLGIVFALLADVIVLYVISLLNLALIGT